MADLILKPIFLDNEGILSRLQDDAIINISGTSCSKFTVNGKSVALVDATSATPGEVGLTLQKIYDETARNGPASFKLQTGKSLVIATTANEPAFLIDAETGKVTITGDLEVLGDTNTVVTTITDTDFWVISPSAGTTTALKIEPDAGVVPIVDLMTVRRTRGSPSVFRITKDGDIVATQNLTVNGQINGVSLTEVKSTADSHYAGTGSRHAADHIDIAAIPSLANTTTVQAALSALSDKVTTAAVGRVVGYEHIQGIASKTWTISHGKNTRRVSVVVYDEQWEQVIPGSVKINGPDTVTITFSASMAGRAMLSLF